MWAHLDICDQSKKVECKLSTRCWTVHDSSMTSHLKNASVFGSQTNSALLAVCLLYSLFSDIQYVCKAVCNKAFPLSAG